MNVLSGYKTYIVAALLAIVGIVEGLLGMDIPGVTVSDDWMLVLLNALGLGALRAGVAKAGS